MYREKVLSLSNMRFANRPSVAAMLKFPVRYTFNIVGKTFGDQKANDEYVDAVKNVVRGTSGDEEGMVCRITPRGKSFTKVQCEVEVQSASMINAIYAELDEIDMTVMRF